MKIAINSFNLYNLPQKINRNQGLKLKPQPLKDTISFGCRSYDPNVPEDIQLYRSISEAEFKALLNGKTMRGSSHYATSDPRGWGGRDWNSGYVYDKSSPYYFITFRTDTDFMADDRRDSDTDTRYGVDGYSIDDVLNIRKGSNAHGEMVYSANFEEDKAKDLELKRKEIELCKKIVLSKETSIDARNEAWDILASYAKEFPNLIDFECDFEDETFVNGLTFYLTKADNPEYFELGRKCIKSQIEHPFMDIRIDAVELLKKRGDESDVKDIVTLIKMGKVDSYVAASVLNKMVKDDSMDEFMIKNLNTKSPTELLALAEFFAYRNKDFKYNDLFRDVLTNTITEDMYLRRQGFGPYDSYKLMGAIDTMVKELGKEGDIRSLECLKKYYIEERPYDYPSGEAKDAIDMILAKNNMQA